MKAGDTFRQLGHDEHLWMILSDPEQDPERILVVSFTTWAACKEPACRIAPGEHPFVHHETCVSYHHSRIVRLTELQALQADGFLEPYARLSPELLRRIRNRAGDSIFMPLEAWELLEEQDLIDLAE